MIRISFVKFVTLGFPVNASDKRVMNPTITPNAPKTAPETGAAVATTGNDFSSWRVPDIF